MSNGGAELRKIVLQRLFILGRDYFFLLFGFFTSFFAPCRDAAMSITSLFRKSPLMPASDAGCIVRRTFRRLALVLTGFYRIFLKFALPFFLVLFLLCDFLLTLLKTKIRLSHGMPPQKEIFEQGSVLTRAGRTRDQPAALQCSVPLRSQCSLSFGPGCSMQRVTATVSPASARFRMAARV